MTWFIFLAGLANLAVGFAVTVCLERRGFLAFLAAGEPACLDDMNAIGEPVAPPASPAVAIEEPAEQPPEPVAEPAVAVEDPVEEGAPAEEEPRVAAAEPAMVEDIPQEWQEVLAADHIVAGSFVEASAQVLRLEVGRYREQLISIDGQIRQCRAEPDRELLERSLKELKEANLSWLDQQATATDQFGSHSENLGQFSTIGERLEEVLTYQAAQIETTCSNIDQLDVEEDICGRLIVEIRRLLDLAHGLRDCMQDSLLAVAKAEGRLHSIDKKLHRDSLTGIFNRTGIESILEDFWRDDLNRTRQVSVALLDIDRFGRLLEELGARLCDNILVELGQLVDRSLRKERGFDVAARLAGQQFILFYGDTGPQNATSAVERVRQTVEQASWQHAGGSIPLTVSAAVVEIMADETAEAVWKRLNRAVREAKKAGRNRTMLDVDSGPTSVDPPEYEVTQLVVRLG